MMRLIRLAATLASLTVAPLAATAQTFPTKPITMLVVFAPGGATDVLARLVADHMSRTLGQRVIVENVSGAGGTIGGARGAQAEPDGYTLTVGSLGSHSAAPSIYRSIKYDPRELDPIGVIAGTPLYFVVRNEFPAKTFQDFQAHVKASPGKVTNGHAGVGSTNHLACLLLMHITKLEFNSVAYRGEGPAIQDLIAGHVDSACALAPAIVPHIRAGKVRGLMGAARERAALTPDTPSAPEAGAPDYIFQGWNAIFAPKGTPAPVRAKLVEALNAALADSAVRGRIEELGSVPPRPEEQNPEHLARMVRSEVDRWSVVIKAAGISEP
jgi:tripartite-type tricarboxylate transporter receptor subunit TctC